MVECNDVELAKIVKRCQELPGRELFGFLDDDGEIRDVTSTDVNDFLRAASGEDITAKDFRTGAGTLPARQASSAESLRNPARSRQSARLPKW